MSDEETVKKLEEWQTENARSYFGYCAPYRFKGVEYWIGQERFDDANSMDGVKREPIYLS